SAATSVARTVSTSATTTSAPRAASARPIPRPIPLAPPVTTATLPAISMGTPSAPPALRLLAISVQACDQSGRRHLPIPGRDQAGDDTPVGLPVDAHADPAEVTDVGGSEELHRILLDDRLLHSRSRGEPDRDVVRAMMVRVHL